MIDSVPKFERLMNLVAYLLASGEPVPFSTIRKSVVGYNDYAREDAVEKRFDRDKKELREIGIPVEYVSSDERGRDGYFIQRDQYYHHELDLSPDEAALLVVLANAAKGGSDAISSNLRAALLKISIDSPLQEEVQRAVSERHMKAFTRGKRDRPSLDNLARLVAAVGERRKVKFKYKKPGGRDGPARNLEPFGLGYREGEWYLVGRDLEREALRQFKVVRIQGAVTMKKGPGGEFEVPAGFDIEEHIERSPWEFEGEKTDRAEILFDADVAWMVEENLRPDQTFEWREDGTGVLHLKVNKSPNTHQRLLLYLASYSGQCAILSPPWLRRQAMAHLKQLSERYG
ncbi:MAG: helix-turn-helix transcriptional regulator [Planctomycetota bacterium]|jgi:predicted DNA-binding transcriptional regulator YafY